VLVKGVLRGDDALACLDAGAAGVVVSNHGGRQLDRTLATADALPEVVAAVAGRDTGAGRRRAAQPVSTCSARWPRRRRRCCSGRPVLWALAADGAAGVQACLEALTADLAHAMGLAGAARLAEVSASLVAR
jgi:4-hydroxymandelate oxidase